jgi:hypothetical protein
MWTRNGTDTLLIFTPGSDIDEGTGASVGALGLCPGALQTLAGWTGRPGLGMYTYPSGGDSELWDFQKARGFTGPVLYRSFAIPNGYTIADVKAGNCDAIWTKRAQNMVAEGQGSNCIYSPGYEGSGSNFNGGASQKVDTSTVDGVQLSSFFGFVLGSKNWAAAVSRQVHVMRQVAGWTPWIDLNFDVYDATDKGLDPDPFRMVTESFQSIGKELYPYDDFKGSFSASNPADHAKVIAFIQHTCDMQQVACAKYGVPLIFGEAGPMINPNGHSTGDDPAFVQWIKDYCMDLSHNVAALGLYNGTTGDTSRCFTWNQTTKVYTKNTAQFPLSSQKIIDIMDPANFINRTPSGGGTMYTQAQLDAAVAAQAALDATSTGATALAALQALYDTDHALLLATQTELAEAYAQIAKAIADYETFIGNFGGLLP